MSIALDSRFRRSGLAIVAAACVVSDLGYQAGFQSNDSGERHTSYLHLGAGFAVGL